MALARARELTDSVMAAINNGTDPDSYVQIFPYSGSHSDQDLLRVNLRTRIPTQFHLKSGPGPILYGTLQTFIWSIMLRITSFSSETCIYSDKYSDNQKTLE